MADVLGFIDSAVIILLVRQLNALSSSIQRPLLVNKQGLVNKQVDAASYY